MFQETNIQNKEQSARSSLFSQNEDDFDIEECKKKLIKFMDSGISSDNDNDGSSKKRKDSEMSWSLSTDKGREPFNSDKKRELDQQGFTDGMIRLIEKYMTEFTLRIWIVDNSHSMSREDGHRVIEQDDDDHSGVSGDNHHHCNKIEIVPCSRWKEMQETVKVYAGMAASLQAPTIFRLLNDPGRRVGPKVFGVSDKWYGLIKSDLELANKIMAAASPTGPTPLCQHMINIRDQVTSQKSDLDKSGQKISIIIATDGIPTDEKYYGEFIQILDSMKDLPIWISIRLITDDEVVIKYYQDLDTKIERVVGVLGDYLEESIKVQKYNGWLNNVLPLYRLSEMGCSCVFPLLNQLSKRKLKKEEVVDFCDHIFVMENMPDPTYEFERFTSKVMQYSKSKKHWNIEKKEATPIINEEKFDAIYGENTCRVC